MGRQGNLPPAASTHTVTTPGWHLPQQTPQRAERSSHRSAGGRILWTGYSMHLLLLAHHRHCNTGTRQHSITGARLCCQRATLCFGSCSTGPLLPAHEKQIPPSSNRVSRSKSCVSTARTRRGRRGDRRVLEQAKMLRILLLAWNRRLS